MAHLGIREAVLAMEGTQFPGKSYAETVLIPAYDNAKTTLIEPMLAIHKAHLIMLVEQSIIPKDDALKILSAIHHIDIENYQRSSYTGKYEDLFFAIEDQILREAGDLAGNLHIGRSRNDMGVAMYRIVLRDLLVSVLNAVSELQATLLTMSELHAETIMLGYTHTQPAQPTTLGHYFLAVYDTLSRDYQRLHSALHTCNHSPLGAAAITTSGFPINRERVSELLGFEGLVENSYDAIGGADYIAEIASALQVALLGLGRYTQDLLLWSTKEFGAIVVAEPYVQVSSIMPQKRNPVSCEHIRALASRGVGECQAILQMLHNTPFGDIVDTEDDLQPHLWSALRLASKLFHLFGCVVATMSVDKERLRERAVESYAVITELADTLVRSSNMGFRTAHSISGHVARLATIEGLKANEVGAEIVAQAAQDVIGRPLCITDEVVKQALDAVHFVHIRALPGGPAPREVLRMMEYRQTKLQQTCHAMEQFQQSIELKMSQLNLTPQTWNETLG